MKQHLLLTILLISLFAVSAGAVIAAPKIINITKKLGGVAGNVFTLDGQLRVRSLFVRDSLDAKYDNSISGLKAKTYKGAIDELGISVTKLIGGSSVKATSVSSVKASSLESTTWKGYGYSYGLNPLVNGMVSKTAEMTVTFTPTSSTTGTFTSSPLYVFAPAGGDLFSRQYGDVINTPGGISRCGTPASAPNGGNYPTGTFEGKYEITDDFMVWTAPTSSSHSNCVVPEQSSNSYSRLSEISSKGTTLYINNSTGNQMILTRQ